MDWKLEAVVVPVTDVDRSKDFYSRQAGFTVDHDTTIDESTRFVQLTPPGSACSIVLSTGNPVDADVPLKPGAAQGLQLVVADIAAARAELADRGLDVTPVQHFEGSKRVDGPGEGWNSFAFFHDPDGNSWTVQQQG